MKNKHIYIWLPLVIGLCIAVGVFIGNKFSLHSSIQIYRASDKLSTIFDYIDKAYVDSVDVNDLVEETIPSLISQLDPHSTYIPAEEMALTGDELDGHFSGIGVEFLIQSDTIAIVNVIQGGPSEAVGIVPGDRVVYVNDSLFVGGGLNNTKAFKHLRGPKDSQVKLGIKRNTSDTIITFTVTRADVPVKSLDAAYEIKKGIGYIKISRFGGTTYNEFITALAKLKKGGCTSFIIDLQQNGGGYLNAAVLMTNEFLAKDQLIVYTKGRTYTGEQVVADGSGSCQHDQVVVLIDEGSASASEIFSGALQDHDRGLIMGRRSFGKGLVQNQHVFKDGSALRLTVARYHTPSGRCIQKAYENGKKSEYSQDLVNRYLRGEMDNQDSIKLDNLPLFETTSGRPVYGNDGIMPDIFVPRDTIGLNSYYISLSNSGSIREFSFNYADTHRSELKKFKTWQEAQKYLSSQPLAYQLANYAVTKGIRKRPYLLEECRSILQMQLEAIIIRNLFSDEGFYSILNDYDILIKKAVEQIEKDKATPDAIAKQMYK